MFWELSLLHVDLVKVNSIIDSYQSLHHILLLIDHRILNLIHPWLKRSHYGGMKIWVVDPKDIEVAIIEFGCDHILVLAMIKYIPEVLIGEASCEIGLV